jgi:hypothetical protein
MSNAGETGTTSSSTTMFAGGGLVGLKTEVSITATSKTDFLSKDFCGGEGERGK